MRFEKAKQIVESKIGRKLSNHSFAKKYLRVLKKQKIDSNVAKQIGEAYANRIGPLTYRGDYKNVVNSAFQAERLRIFEELVIKVCFAHKNGIPESKVAEELGMSLYQFRLVYDELRSKYPKIPNLNERFIPKAKFDSFDF